MDLIFTVNEQAVTRTDSEKPVNMSEGYLQLIFDFMSEDWENTNRQYIYFKGGDGDYRFELETVTGYLNNSAEFSKGVIVPSFVSMGKKFIFGVYGVDNNGTIRITTNLSLVRLGDSKFTDGGIAIIDTLDHLEADKIDKVDIVDNLTTNVATKVLSAKQGKVLKDLTDTKADSSDMTTALNGKSNVGHNHDDRYYTETEMTTLLSGKSDTGHTHSSSDVTGLTATRNVVTDDNGKLSTEYKNNHNHGSMGSSGTINSDINSVNKVLVTNDENQIKTAEKSTLLEGYIAKSNTSGLVKNDGTIDTSTYLTEHQSLKTINNESIIGTGNITIEGGGGSVDIATSWGSTPSDSKVPSEKLAKDSLDGKVDKENGKGLFSGSYNDLSNKPTIPSDVSDLTDSHDIIPSDVADLTDTQNTAFTPKSHTHGLSDVNNTSTVEVTITYTDTTTATVNLVTYTPPTP